MTYPLRDPKGITARRRPKPGEPFDPEDLSRRLTAHLAEQKLKSERRREARAAKAAAVQQNGGYHHVPKVAALAFERTATPSDTTRQIHKLSQVVLKPHLDLLHEDLVPGHGVTNLQETKARDQAMVEKELLRNRNQFQWTRDMEEAVDVDLGRDLYKPQQRTFNIPEFAHLMGKKAPPKAPRPLSMGDVLSRDEVQLAPRPRTKLAFDAMDRTDWVQRDGEVESRKQKKDWATPFLRRRDSIWILGSRKEKNTKQNKDEAVASIGNFDSPPDKKGTFLARFKRHPS